MNRSLYYLLQHYLNCLHIYCRLIDLGVPIKWAGKIGKLYERIFKLFKKEKIR